MKTVFLAFLAATMTIPPVLSAPKELTKWKITGQLEEACSCNAACPCWFDSKPTRMTCGGNQVLFIQKGNYGGSSKITNPPGADPIHHQYAQGKTTTMTYTDSDQNWDWKDTNYMLGTFTVDSDQYKKYAAGLAQKMAAKPKAEGTEKK